MVAIALAVVVLAALVAVMETVQDRCPAESMPIVRRPMLDVAPVASLDGNRANHSATTATATLTRSVTVMQWNTLADSLCGPEQFPSTAPCALRWTTRAPLLVQHVRDLDPDVVALQEVDAIHYRELFVPALAASGYGGVFQKKRNNSDGCALFYRRALFALVAHEGHAYGAVGNAAQNQIYLLAQLELRNDVSTAPTPQPEPRVGGARSGQFLYVAVTHLKAKPEFAQQRVGQAAELLVALNQFIVNHHPPSSSDQCEPMVIMCGDMNDEPQSLMYRLLAEHYQSAYDDHYSIAVGGGANVGSGTGSGTRYTTYKKRGAVESLRVIDYIFYSPQTLRVAALLEIPPIAAFPNRLPDLHFPSDHLSLLARFETRCDSQTRFPSVGPSVSYKIE